MRIPRIVAMGGGGFSTEPEKPLLDDFILTLARRRRGRPRVCLLPTASGDASDLIVRFHGAFDGRAEASHLGLFDRTVTDLRAFVLAQDVVYVGGGNTANMLAVWRVHGLDSILVEAWRAGVVLAGLSAGAICWFEAGVTDSFGSSLGPLRDGLRLLQGSMCPHYDGEPLRRPTYRRLVGEGFPGGYAADDGAAFVFAGTRLEEVVTSRPEARGWRVILGSGGVIEEPLPARYLGA